MEPVLARVTRGTSWRRWPAAALCCLLAGPVDGHAEYAVERVTETEVWAFLWESALAAQRCDDRWEEQHIAPSATLTHTVLGKPTVTWDREEYLRWFRENCRFYMRQPFSRYGWAVSVGPYSTTARWTLKTKEAGLPSFMWFPREAGSGEGVWTLIKAGGVVQVLETQATYTLDQQEGASR